MLGRRLSSLAVRLRSTSPPILRTTRCQRHRHLAQKHRTGRGPQIFQSKLLDKLELKQAPAGTAVSQQTRPSSSPSVIGYPVLVRPSFVLGGRAMMIVYTDEDLRQYMQHCGGSQSFIVPCWSIDSSKTLPRWMSIVISDGETTVVGCHHGAHRGSRYSLR